MAATKATYATLEAAFHLFHGIYQRWVALVQEYLLTRHGHESLYKVMSINTVVLHAMRLGMNEDQLLRASKSSTIEMAALRPRSISTHGAGNPEAVTTGGPMTRRRKWGNPFGERAIAGVARSHAVVAGGLPSPSCSPLETWVCLI